MSVSMPTLQDALVALVITIGIAVAVTIAIVAAGAFFDRDRAPKAQVGSLGPAPAEHPTQTDDVRHLVLR